MGLGSWESQRDTKPRSECAVLEFEISGMERCQVVTRSWGSHGSGRRKWKGIEVKKIEKLRG